MKTNKITEVRFYSNQRGEFYQVNFLKSNHVVIMDKSGTHHEYLNINSLFLNGYYPEMCNDVRQDNPYGK